MRPRGVPRGSRASPRLRPLSCWCFNEAAGRTPRKPTSRREAGQRGVHAASMRPRGVPRGSRPSRRRQEGVQRAASMRPRGVPRGSRPSRPQHPPHLAASMRPRGVPRGSHGRDRRAVRAGRAASMRPRGVPRGSRRRTAPPTSSPRARFNEAAGRTPRKPNRPTSFAIRPTSFNEAAGRTPRKPPARARPAACRGASMRPRGVPRGSPRRRPVAPTPGQLRFNEAAGRTPRKPPS